jgi:hypothetical protein
MDLPKLDKNKPLTKSLLNKYYEAIKNNGKSDPEFYHMIEIYLMEIYIHQIAENMLSDDKIHDFSIILRKINKIDYPRWFA